MQDVELLHRQQFDWQRDRVNDEFFLSSPKLMNNCVHFIYTVKDEITKRYNYRNQKKYADVGRAILLLAHFTARPLATNTFAEIAHALLILQVPVFQFLKVCFTLFNTFLAFIVIHWRVSK